MAGWPTIFRFTEKTIHYPKSGFERGMFYIIAYRENIEISSNVIAEN